MISLPVRFEFQQRRPEWIETFTQRHAENQPVQILQRQRAQQQCIDRTKDGCVRTDAHSKCSKRDATKKHDGAFLHNHAQYSSWLSTERHPDADLTRAPRDRISFDSVETNYGQTKRKSPKDGEQRRASAHKPEVQVRIKMLRERSQRNDRD